MVEDTLELAGSWLVRADPQDAGAARGWHEAAAWAGEKRTMTLPNPMQKELGAEHRGVAWVARKVELPHSWRKTKNERLWIRFESVATDATIWVNAVRIGRHVGDYIPFQFEITDAAEAGEAWIVVRVDQMHAPRPGTGTLTENGHITKGFHDVLSLQHSGVWCGVELRRTWQLAIRPNGVHASLNDDGTELTVAVELEPHNAKGRITVEADFPGPVENSPGGESIARVSPGQLQVEVKYKIWPKEWQAALWSPDSPTLGELHTFAHAERPGGTLQDHHVSRFAIRSITTGGPPPSDNRHILLNGKPLLIRGILHWGHEPDHISPAPSPDQVRAEFTRLKEIGFNCVCLCMWYPPEYYFDIADEVGMLIWQEHPVWKSPMHEEHIPEYQRLFEQFFRRDRRHPSVIIVSGSCEHERFNPRLAEWWWKTAHEMVPGALKQLQTGFIGWIDPEKTDLYDEHVYDSSGRWVRFVEDVQATTAELPRKPFIMGETIIGTAWVDTAHHHKEGKGGWWYPKGIAECAAFESELASAFGTSTLERFLATAHQQNVAIRKFQVEALRCFDGCAGFVMNQIRDVPIARLGFMDDFGRWRVSKEETLAWLSDRALLLRTPGHRRGLESTAVQAEIGISNFGEAGFQGEIDVTCDTSSPNSTPCTQRVPMTAEPGQVRFAALSLDEVASDWPVRSTIHARAEGIEPNTWRIWRFPAPSPLPSTFAGIDGLPFTSSESELDFEERGYSSGWGLKIHSWAPLLQTASQLIPSAVAWSPGTPIPAQTTLIATHRLTPDLLDFMLRGGRILLLANKTLSGLSAKFINVWGQCPLILERGPIKPGDSDWITDLLHIDLFDRHPRAIAVDDFGIADQVEPLIRLVFTHDRGTPKLFDAAFFTRVGSGMLIASSLDHSGAAGRFLLHQLLNWGATTHRSEGAALDPAWIREHVLK